MTANNVGHQLPRMFRRLVATENDTLITKTEHKEIATRSLNLKIIEGMGVLRAPFLFSHSDIAPSPLTSCKVGTERVYSIHNEAQRRLLGECADKIVLKNMQPRYK